MVPWSQELFVHRLETQCRRARVAFERLERMCSAPGASVDELYEAVDSLVSQAGKISRFFFPGSTRKGRDPKAVDERANWLRQELGVKDDSIFRCRAVRDHLEHFDERLHGADPTTRLVMSGNVGPPGAIFCPNADPLDNFDPSTMTMSFRNDTLKLGELIREVERVQQEADRLSRTAREEMSHGLAR